MLRGVEQAEVVDDEVVVLAELLEEIHHCGGKPGATSGTLDDVLLVAT